MRKAYPDAVLSLRSSPDRETQKRKGLGGGRKTAEAAEIMMMMMMIRSWGNDAHLISKNSEGTCWSVFGVW